MRVPSNFLAILAAAYAAAHAASATAATPAVAGEYDSPLGRVRIVADGAAWKGTVLSPTEGLPLQPGDEILKATLLDDSLAGQLRMPLFKSPGCKQKEAWASAVLLVGDAGLAGAVHLPKGCKGPAGKNGGMTFNRPGARPAPLPVVEPDPEPVAATERPPPRPPRPKAPAAGDRRAARERAREELKDGLAYLQEGNFEQARRRFLAALHEDATVPEAYNGVGVTYRMRNDFPRALDWYKRSLAVNPDFGDAYYNMACIYALQGEKDLALRYLQIAALNGYVTADSMDHDEDLDSLRGEPAYRALSRHK
ncbi:MAG: tetratricopeptide repeat protein [Anaeromyxobacteraceae bacterium]